MVLRRSTFLKIVAASAVAVIPGTVVVSSGGSHDLIPAPAGAPETAAGFTERADAGSPPVDAPPEVLASIPDMVLGSDAAPVRIVEYASFTCVHCAAFHDETVEDFKRDYIDTGRVKLTYREIFFDRYGL